MSNVTSTRSTPRVLFLGMAESGFSYACLGALLQRGIEVAAVVLPAARIPGRTQVPIRLHEPPRIGRGVLPLLHSPSRNSIVALARERGLPVWESARLAAPETLATLTAYAPDLICVACFPRRLPEALLALPRLGCLNVHPSLLPANRGPEPLFWTFRLGCRQTGVTIHLMNERLDAGDIVAQEAFPVPDGVSYAHLERICAEHGAELLARAAWELYTGRAVRRPQDERLSSYHAFPTAEDFVIPAARWEARHVYNFICGLVDWGEPLIVEADGERFAVREAISYSHDGVVPDVTDQEKRVGERAVRCCDGWIVLRLSEAPEQGWGDMGQRRS